MNLRADASCRRENGWARMKTGPGSGPGTKTRTRQKLMALAVSLVVHGSCIACGKTTMHRCPRARYALRGCTLCRSGACCNSRASLLTILSVLPVRLIFQRRSTAYAPGRCPIAPPFSLPFLSLSFSRILYRSADFFQRLNPPTINPDHRPTPQRSDSFSSDEDHYRVPRASALVSGAELRFSVLAYGKNCERRGRSSFPFRRR